MSTVVAYIIILFVVLFWVWLILLTSSFKKLSKTVRENEKYSDEMFGKIQFVLNNDSEFKKNDKVFSINKNISGIVESKKIKSKLIKERPNSIYSELVYYYTYYIDAGNGVIVELDEDQLVKRQCGD